MARSPRGSKRSPNGPKATAKAAKAAEAAQAAATKKADADREKEVLYVRPIGEADKTYDGKIVAIRLFNKYQQQKGYPLFQDLTQEDVESDNLQNIIRRFAGWLATFNKPKFHNEYFKPKATIVGKCVSYLEPCTKRKYLERLKAVLKDKFKKHPDWNDQNEWWTLLLSNFDTEAKRFKLRSQGNVDDTDRTVRCLYKKNGGGRISMTRDMELFHSMEQIDLTYICKKVSQFYCRVVFYINMN